MSDFFKEWLRYTLQDIVLIVLVLVLAIVALLVSDIDTALIVIVAFNVIAFLLILIVGYASNLWKPSRLRKITESNLWVHWKYGSGEWENLTGDTDLKIKNATQAEQWMPILLRNALLYTVIFAGISGFALRDDLLVALVGACIVGGCVFALSYRSARRVIKGLVNPYARSKPEVFIGPVGIIYGDNGMFFNQSRLSIKEVDIDADKAPSRFSILIEYKMGNKRMPYELTIPIPNGQESDASTLVDCFHRELIRTSDHN